MMRSFVMLLFLGVSHFSVAQTLFEYGGKSYKRADLAPANQQALFDIELQYYRQVETAVQTAALDLYFTEKAKKTGKSRAELEVAELRVSPPSEKQIKSFYEENKARIPQGYAYDKIKPQLIEILQRQQRAEKKEKLFDRIRKEKKFRYALKKPVSPKVAINTKPFFKKGKAGAKVQIVEFADYQCPHCRSAATMMKKIMEKYGKKAEFVFIDFPINRSGISTVVAEGAYCASKQGKYWEYHYKAFEGQAGLTKESPGKLAKALGLKTADFSKCLKSAAAKSYVAKGKEEGARVGVGGTPTIYINGEKYADGHTYKAMAAAIDARLRP